MPAAGICCGCAPIGRSKTRSRASSLPSSILPSGARRKHLLESERRLQLAREATSLGIIDYDAEADELWFDARCRELWGLGEDDAVNLDVFFAGIAEKRPAEGARSFRAARLDPAATALFSVEFQIAGKARTSGCEPLERRFSPTAGKPPRSARLVGPIQDITATKAWEAQQVLLLQELSHRVKNTLTVIMSMARQTLRATPSPRR